MPSINPWQNCNSSGPDGWITPTSNLATFEVNCYFFGLNAWLTWDQADRQCVDIGGRLAIIENNAEFKWIMQVYAAMYQTVGGLYVDATRARYGNISFQPAWRGGTDLASGNGTLFNNLFITQSTQLSFYSMNYYYHAFYLTKTGALQDILTNSTIPNGGYLCKKYQTAPTPSTVGYNLGYCFPSLPSSASCPVGWKTFTPNQNPFCYKSVNGTLFGPDDYFRQCHQMGSDLAYIENQTTELFWLYSSGIINSTSSLQWLNAHPTRYGAGPQFSWSNGVQVVGVNSTPAPSCYADYSCNVVFAQYQNQEGMSMIAGDCPVTTDITGAYSITAGCKRPLCGITFTIMHSALHVLDWTVQC